MVTMSEINETIKRDAEVFVKIIKSAKYKMRNMLASVFEYNFYFCKEEKKKEQLKKILEAMSVIDRKFFTPYESDEISYSDNALSIGRGQTISQPSTVARMLLASELYSGLNVLEVGTGSGWNAAIIAYIVKPGKVVTTDRIAELVDKAKKNIAGLERHLAEHLTNLSLVAEDALNEKSSIWQQQYNRILITAGIHSDIEQRIEKMAQTLLKDKGILVCPYTAGPLLVYRKEEGKIKKSHTGEEYVFVPLLDGIEK